MKLNKDYLTHISGEEQIIVATGESMKKFCGIAKGNTTTALIVDMLKNDVTKEDIVNSLLEKFEVEREVVDADVTEILEKLKSIGALDE